MVSALDSDRAVHVPALAGALRCVLGQDTLLSECLSPPRGVEILLVASCYGNWDKPRPDGPLGSYTDFTFMEYLSRFIYVQGLKKKMLAKGRCVRFLFDFFASC